MSTDASPISSRPMRCSMATRRTPAHRARMAAPISRIFVSAIGAWASYSRNFTGRPSVWLRTTPEKITTPPAPGSSTCAAISSGDRGRSTTAKMSCTLLTAATHRRKQTELVVGSKTVLGLDVVVADGEQRVRTIAREIGMAGNDGLPRRLHGAALGDVNVHPLLPGGFSIPGKETDADAHGLLRSGGTDRSRRTT